MQRLPPIRTGHDLRSVAIGREPSFCTHQPNPRATILNRAVFDAINREVQPRVIWAVKLAVLDRGAGMCLAKRSILRLAKRGTKVENSGKPRARVDFRWLHQRPPQFHPIRSDIGSTPKIDPPTLLPGLISGPQPDGNTPSPSRRPSPGLDLCREPMVGKDLCLPRCNCVFSPSVIRRSRRVPSPTFVVIARRTIDFALLARSQRRRTAVSRTMISTGNLAMAAEWSLVNWLRINWAAAAPISAPGCATVVKGGV